VAAGADVVGDALVVEVEKRVLVDDDAAAADLLLDRRRCLEQSRVVLQKGVVGIPLAADERVADEHVARCLHVDAVVRHEPVRDDRDAVEHRLLVHHRRSALL